MPGQGDGAVDVVHHGGPPQERADHPAVFLVTLDQPVGPAGKAGGVDVPALPPVLHRRHGEEGGAAIVVGFQKGDGGLGALLVLGDDVLQGGPQGDLDGHGIAVLCPDEGGHRPPDAPELAPGGGLHHPANRLAKALIFPLHGPEEIQALGFDLPLAGGLLRGLGQAVQFFLPGLGPELKAPEHIFGAVALVFVFFDLVPESAGLGLFGIQAGGEILFLGPDGAAPGADLGDAAVQSAHPRPGLGGLGLVETDLGIQPFQLGGKVPGAFCRLLHLGEEGVQLGGKVGGEGFQPGELGLPGGLLPHKILPRARLLLQLLPAAAEIILVVADMGLVDGDVGPQVALPLFGLAEILPESLPFQLLFVELVGEGGGTGLKGLGLPLPGREHPFGVVIVDPRLGEGVLELVQAIEPDTDLQHPELVPVDEEALGLFGLSLQRAHLAFQLGEDIPDADEIFLTGGQLALALLLPVAELGDAGGFLEDLPAVGAFYREDLVDSPLADNRIAVPTQTGVHEQLVDVPETDGLAVDVKLALAGAVIAAGDHHLAELHREAPVGVVHHQGHLAEALGAAAGRAAEDDVFHLAAPEGLGALLPQDPADGVHDVALAAAVGADDGGDAPAEVHERLVRKGFETLDLDGLEEHPLTPFCPKGIKIHSGLLYQKTGRKTRFSARFYAGRPAKPRVLRAFSGFFVYSPMSSRAALAAACSASFLLWPRPSARTLELMRTSMTKSLSWSGPLSLLRR